jgi:hypothetical protein
VKLLLLTLLIALSSCGNRSMYSIMSAGPSPHCDKLHGVKRLDCFVGAGLTYNAYETERQRLLKEKHKEKY